MREYLHVPRRAKEGGSTPVLTGRCADVRVTNRPRGDNNVHHPSHLHSFIDDGDTHVSQKEHLLHRGTAAFRGETTDDPIPFSTSYNVLRM